MGCKDALPCISVAVCEHVLKQQIFLASTAGEGPWPYILVNIGSGVSLIKVDAGGRHSRVSGSSLGGGTFWGLARLLTGCTTFDQVLELSAAGDYRNVRTLQLWG